MKTKHLFFLSFISWFSVYGQEPDPLYSFVLGNYIIIGKYPDSEKTYSGKMTIAEGKETDSVRYCEVIRHINGKEIKGKAWVAKATSDQIPILRIQFTDNKKQYDGAFLIKGDLDNYARATGTFWGKDTKKPGLEAWFAGAVWDAENP